jgi:hypothetical protein
MQSHSFNAVGFQTFTEEEKVVLRSFREGQLHLPYKATENFLPRQKTYEALCSLSKRGLITVSPYTLTRKGLQVFETLIYSSYEF